MAMIKMFDDRYINLDVIHMITVEPEEGAVWNVYSTSLSGSMRVRQWLGQFESKEDAIKAIEELMSRIGIQIVEFIPDLN